jgi:superoxide reductase
MAMNTFICGKCGYVAFNIAPERCPVCAAPKPAFTLDPAAIKKPLDPANLSDLEKKHIPVIEVKKRCGLVGPGCVDAHIKVGAILHVMEEKHFIMYIDVYLDYNFIARYHLSPEKINPVLGIHLKAASGELAALEHCNIHGRWIQETEI